MQLNQQYYHILLWSYEGNATQEDIGGKWCNAFNYPRWACDR